MIRWSRRSVAPPLVVLAAALGLGAYPAHQAAEDASTRQARGEASLVDLSQRAATLTALAEDGDLLEAELIALDELVPGEHDIAGFIVELDEITHELGVELRDVVPSQTSDRDVADAGTPPGWTSVGLNVRIVGTYLQLIEFTEATTRTDRLAVIDSMTVSTIGQGRIDASISMRLFRNDNPSDGLIARFVESRTEEPQP